MAANVIDASALGAVLFGEPKGPAMVERLRDRTLYAPALLPFEIANVCVTKLRRHPNRRGVLLEAFAMLDRIDINIVEIDHRETVDVAERFGLTAYDASYLWLAQRLDVELVTLDVRLARATERGTGA
jgi:predicted nucleic acid-binding protein